jgi:hypothetical protein
MSEQPANGTEGWRQRIREAVNEDLLEVRYCQRGDDVYFLLVHRPAARMPALERFLDALRGDDMPSFDVRMLDEAEVAGQHELMRDYSAV